MVGIYQILNLASGKRYVGQAKDCFMRKREHFYALRRNEHFNSHLQAAWNKYGESAFEFSILEECSLEQLDEKERYYIDLYNTVQEEFGYNFYRGKVSLIKYPKPHITHTQETKERIAQAASDWWKTATEEQKLARGKNISKALKGRKLSAQEVERLRICTSNWWANATEEERSARTQAIKDGRSPLSDEVKAKISAAHKGRKLGPLSEEVKMKISKSLTGRKIQVDMSPETTKRRSENQKKVMSDPAARERLREANRRQFQDPEKRERHRQACIAATERKRIAQGLPPRKVVEVITPEERARRIAEGHKKQGASLKGHFVSEDTRRKIGEANRLRALQRKQAKQ